jgi:threonine aldolase
VPRGFASDNASGVHPEVLAALSRVNEGHVSGYGHDPLTERVHAALAEQFGAGSQSLLVFNGSAANVLCLRVTCRPWQAVICADCAHMNVDECGAPEVIGHVKLLTVATPDGKLTPELVESRIERIGFEHAVQPRVVSVTQPTELGTLYQLDELRALADHAHSHGLLLHIDGSRLTNAAAALGCSLGETSTQAGADIVSFGGTKNGLMLGEAVVIADPALADGFVYLRKQTLQLASKMRYLSAQFEVYLTGEHWRRTAAHANAMAARLADAVRDVPGLRITQAVETNAVFAQLPHAAIVPLQERFPFYVWDERTDEVRWMCSWDTTEDDIDSFAAAVGETLAPAISSRPGR